ncbi:MAG: hypothetical protein ABSE00_01420 [Chitinispirillaceae bacterium]|jgi:hypothetical protein
MAVRYHVGTKIGKNSGAGISFGNKEISDVLSGYLIFLIIPIMMILALVQWFFQNILITGPILGIIVALIAIWIKTAPIRAERRRIENLVDNIKTDYDFIIEHDKKPYNYEELIDNLSGDFGKLSNEVIEQDSGLIEIKKYAESEKVKIADEKEMKINELANKISSSYHLINEKKSDDPEKLLIEIEHSFVELGKLNKTLLKKYPFLEEINSVVTYWLSYYVYFNYIAKAIEPARQYATQSSNRSSCKPNSPKPSRRAIGEDTGFRRSLALSRQNLKNLTDEVIKKEKIFSRFDGAIEYAKAMNFTNDDIKKVAEVLKFTPWLLEDVKNMRKDAKEVVTLIKMKINDESRIAAMNIIHEAFGLGKGKCYNEATLIVSYLLAKGCNFQISEKDSKSWIKFLSCGHQLMYLRTDGYSITCAYFDKNKKEIKNRISSYDQWIAQCHPFIGKYLPKI